MKKYFLAAVVTVLIILALATRWRSAELPAEYSNMPLTATEQYRTVPSSTHALDSSATENLRSSMSNVSEDFVAAWFDQIRLSEHAKDQLLAALLSKNDPADKESFLLRAYEAMPDDLLLNYAIADFCGHNTHASLCAMVSPRRLIELDSDNGFMWTTVANQAYRNGDIDGAAHHLEQAVGLYRYDSQTPQLMRLIDDSLVRHGAQRNFELVSATAGIQAAQTSPSQYDQLTDMCREQPHWQQTCQGLGQTMMSQGRETMDIAVGQQLVAEFAPEKELPLLPAEWDAFLKSSESPEQARLVAVLTAENPPVSDAHWHEYLRLYEEDGAPAAFYYLIETLMAAESGDVDVRD